MAYCHHLTLTASCSLARLLLRVCRSGPAGSAIQEELADSIQPIIDQGLADFVETDHVLTEQPGTKVYLRATPGHTPGHASLINESNGQKAIITGDCFHHPIQLTKLEMSSRADTDAEQATYTRQEILEEMCDTPTMMFGTHFARPTVGVVVSRGDGAYKLDTDAPLAHVVPIPSARLREIRRVYAKL